MLSLHYHYFITEEDTRVDILTLGSKVLLHSLHENKKILLNNNNTIIKFRKFSIGRILLSSAYTVHIQILPIISVISFIGIFFQSRIMNIVLNHQLFPEPAPDNIS